jgi:transposase InsO family protein
LATVGPLTTTLHRSRYLLTFRYEFKLTLAVSIQQQDAETVAQAFVEEMEQKFGIPQLLLTDQGCHFLGELFANLCKLLKIRRIRTTAYHPHSNGALDRTRRVLAGYLRCYISEDNTNCSQSVRYATN